MSMTNWKTFFFNQNKWGGSRGAAAPPGSLPVHVLRVFFNFIIIVLILEYYFL